MRKHVLWGIAFLLAVALNALVTGLVVALVLPHTETQARAQREGPRDEAGAQRA